MKAKFIWEFPSLYWLKRKQYLGLFEVSFQEACLLHGNINFTTKKLFNPFPLRLFLVTLYLTKITEKDHYLVKRKISK